MYNSQSRSRHFSKQQRSKSRKWQTKIENSKLASTQYKTKKLDIVLKELDDEIRTVIAERLFEKIFWDFFYVKIFGERVKRINSNYEKGFTSYWSSIRYRLWVHFHQYFRVDFVVFSTKVRWIAPKIEKMEWITCMKWSNMVKNWSMRYISGL